MDIDKKSIVFIKNESYPDNLDEIISRLITELPITVTALSNLETLLAALTNSLYKIDFVVLDIFDCNNIISADSFDLIRTIKTVIECTHYKSTNKTPAVKRTTKIVLLVKDTTDPTILQQILHMPKVDHLINGILL